MDKYNSLQYMKIIRFYIGKYIIIAAHSTNRMIFSLINLKYIITNIAYIVKH